MPFYFVYFIYLCSAMDAFWWLTTSIGLRIHNGTDQLNQEQAGELEEAFVSQDTLMFNNLCINFSGSVNVT